MSKKPEGPQVASKEGKPFLLFLVPKSERSLPAKTLSASAFDFADEGLRSVLEPLLAKELPNPLIGISVTGKTEMPVGSRLTVDGKEAPAILESRISLNSPAFVEAEMHKQGLTPAASGEFLRYLSTLDGDAEKGNKGQYKTYVCTIPLPQGYAAVDPKMAPTPKDALQATWYLTATRTKKQGRWEVVPMQAGGLEIHEGLGTRFVFVGVQKER